MNFCRPTSVNSLNECFNLFRAFSSLFEIKGNYELYVQNNKFGEIFILLNGITPDAIYNSQGIEINCTGENTFVIMYGDINYTFKANL